MVNYCRIKDGEYVVGIASSENEFANAISAEEAERLNALFRNAPTAPDGYCNRLRTDTLEWELVELPPEEEQDDEATAEDYEAALSELGVNVDAEG